MAENDFASTQPESEPFPEKSQTNRRTRDPIAKLDAEKLLSEQGFPKLLAMFKKSRFTNTPKNNLMKVMSIFIFNKGIYQIWGQDLFPKLNLNDFLVKTENVCTQGRLKVIPLINSSILSKSKFPKVNV
jgi:hypothetical protein